MINSINNITKEMCTIKQGFTFHTLHSTGGCRWLQRRLGAVHVGFGVNGTHDIHPQQHVEFLRVQKLHWQSMKYKFTKQMEEMHLCSQLQNNDESFAVVDASHNPKT